MKTLDRIADGRTDLVFDLLSKSADAASASAATTTNTPLRRGNRGPANSNDVFYTLGPDSKPRDGVPKGKFAGPKIIPSNVFPGTTHRYDVYVPAQYDPAQPTAVMVFNDGPAMKAEPGDVQGHNDFRKVISFVGSFTDIRGGYIFPELVAESEKKPIRIFMQDGRNDNRRSQPGLVPPERATDERADEERL